MIALHAQKDAMPMQLDCYLSFAGNCEQVRMPFAPPFWGGHFGMLQDKFGVPWMVSTE